jgi:hypothetical protein
MVDEEEDEEVCFSGMWEEESCLLEVMTCGTSNNFAWAEE